MTEQIQKPMSIEQAGNYLKEKSETMPADMKKAASTAPISFALPRDRIAYLMYGISLFYDMPETLKNRWCAIAGKSPVMYTTKEVAILLRKLLILRINGYSRKQIARHMKIKPEMIFKAEEIAIKSIKYAIEKKQNTGVAILGGLN